MSTKSNSKDINDSIVALSLLYFVENRLDTVLPQSGVSTKRGLHHLAYHLAYLWLTVGLPLAYCWLTFGSLLAYLWPIAGLPSLHMVHL